MPCLRGCSNLTSLDLSTFNTNKLMNLTNAFNECTSLSNLNLKNWMINSECVGARTFKKLSSNCTILVSTDKMKEWLLEQNKNFTDIRVENI